MILQASLSEIPRLHVISPSFMNLKSFVLPDGKGPLHYGVCSNYLKEVKAGDHIELFVRRLV